MSNAAAQIFGNGAEEYCQKYGSTWEHVAAIAAKNHQHSVNNPYSQFRNGMTTAEVLVDKKVTDNVRSLACDPRSSLTPFAFCSSRVRCAALLQTELPAPSSHPKTL